MDNILDFEIVLKGIITGILAVYVVIYALRPSVLYPDYILELVDNPWVFVILLFINYYVSLWDTTIALLILLTLVAMVMDIVLFTEGFKIDVSDLASITGIENMTNIATNYKDFNSIILEKLEQRKNKESAYMPRPFV